MGNQHSSPNVKYPVRPERPFTGVSGPSGPKIAKKSQKESFWGSAKKSPKTPPGKVQNYPKLEFLVCEPSDELQESLGPSRPEIPKKSEKSLPGPPAPGSPKVWKKSRKSPEIHQKFQFCVVLDFSGGYFQGLFADPPRKTLFETFFAILGPEGPETPVNGRSGRKNTLCAFEPQILLEIITSRDAKSACFKLGQKRYHKETV